MPLFFFVSVLVFKGGLFSFCDNVILHKNITDTGVTENIDLHDRVRILFLNAEKGVAKVELFLFEYSE